MIPTGNLTSERSVFFQTINEFFDHVYVITLERATKRHEHIRKELEGLDYELFFGKDKENFTIDELKEKGIYNEELAIKHHRFNKKLVAGMIGCSWSHRSVYEDMIRNNYRKILILEDDVLINEKAMPFLPQILKELPSDWELLYFGFDRNENPDPLGFFKKLAYHLQHLIGRHKFSHKTISNIYPKKISTHISRAGYHDQTHAYAITASAATSLMKLQNPISFIADNLLAHAITNEYIRGYICQPKLVNQQSQGDNITAQTYVGD